MVGLIKVSVWLVLREVWVGRVSIVIFSLYCMVFVGIGFLLLELMIVIKLGIIVIIFFFFFDCNKVIRFLFWNLIFNVCFVVIDLIVI